MKVGNRVKHINHETNRGEVLAIENGRVRVEWQTHTSWHDPDELNVILDAEEGLEMLREMFEGYQLDEYKPAFSAVLDGYLRVCLENREMRKRLEGVKQDAKATPAA